MILWDTSLDSSIPTESICHFKKEKKTLSVRPTPNKNSGVSDQTLHRRDKENTNFQTGPV